MKTKMIMTSEKLHKELIKRAGAKQQKLGRRVSIEEIIWDWLGVKK